MTSSAKRISLWVPVGALIAGLAVAAGAIGAHLLEKRFHIQYANQTYRQTMPDSVEPIVKPLSVKRLADFKTGAEYQLYHGLGLILLGLCATWRPSAWWTASGICLLLGVAGFSFGLYGLSILNAPRLGASVVPLGGILFLLGWTLFAVGSLRVTWPAEKTVQI